VSEGKEETRERKATRKKRKGKNEHLLDDDALGHSGAHEGVLHSRAEVGLLVLKVGPALHLAVLAELAARVHTGSNRHG
jgi:hypothetical protein